ncbi:MAG: hypothetical protein IPO23_13345 [Flavobacterium sp.]|nr:hypothetical protein [Flavobacterium sp.]
MGVTPWRPDYGCIGQRKFLRTASGSNIDGATKATWLLRQYHFDWIITGKLI